MNAMTCREVEEQLDLLAAGECDTRTRPLLERHLQNCGACAARSRESQRLLGLLDLHFNGTGLRRLRERIEQEERRPRRRQVVLPFARRAAVLAALFLLSVGLAWWLPVGQPESGPPLQLVALLAKEDQPKREMGSGKDLQLFPPQIAMMEKVKVKSEVPPKLLGEAFRRELHQAQREGKLPLPTAVPLELVLKSTSPVEVRLGGPATELWLEVQGNGVVRIPAGQGGDTCVSPVGKQLQLVPGKPHVIRIDRLIAGRPGRLEYIYLTEPGNYTLSARLRLMVGGTAVTVRSPRIHIPFGKALPPGND